MSVTSTEGAHLRVSLLLTALRWTCLHLLPGKAMLPLKVQGVSLSVSFGLVERGQLDMSVTCLPCAKWVLEKCPSLAGLLLCL